MDMISRARDLIHGFKGDDYTFGLGVFDKLGGVAKSVGQKVSLIACGVGQEWSEPLHEALDKTLSEAGVTLAGDPIQEPRPNAPREDVFRITDTLEEQNADAVIAMGGGSLIDSAKCGLAMLALRDKHPDIEEYFGVGKVSAMLAEEGRSLKPLVGVQIASASSAHLTKYSNITDLTTFQKKLIVDEAVVPPKALFDYETTTTMPRDFTSDGALDGIAHCLEVFMGSSGDALEKVTPVATLGIELVVKNLKTVCDEPGNLEAREAIGLGTDLGGYSIMIGGTNGGHLTSFSLVDLLAHGRACALMNPYYVVFFAPAIEPQLRELARIFRDAGHISSDTDALKGRDLGLAVAEAMISLSQSVDFPTTLGEVDGFTDAHIERALTAAKNPQLASKLQNMPAPLSAETVDEYMGSVLQAAKTGDFSLIKNM